MPGACGDAILRRQGEAPAAPSGPPGIANANEGTGGPRSRRSRRRAAASARATVITPRSPVLRVRDCEVDTVRRVVARADGASLRITVKAMQVLLVLVAERGQVVSRDVLFARVWPDTMPTDDVLTQAIAQLRKAFGDDRDAPRYIETIAKAGYRLLADVAWGDDGRSPMPVGGPAAADDAIVAASPSRDDADAKTIAPPRAMPAHTRRPWRWAMVLATAALAVAVLVATRPWAPSAPAAAAGEPAPGAPPPIVLNYRALTSLPGQERQPSLSPDGSTIAFTALSAGVDRAGIQLQDVRHASARVLTAPPRGYDQLPVWSRDGTRIAFVRVAGPRCELMVVAASGGEPRKVGDCFRGAFSAFDWTPDGRGLVMGVLREQVNASGSLRVLDLASGEWRALAYGIDDDDTDLIPRYSPDGRWLAFRRNTSLADLWMMPAAGGEPRRLTELKGDIRGWDWLPDSSGLVFSHVTTEASLFLYTLADGAIRPLPSLSSGNATYPDIALKDWSMVFEIDQSRSGLFRLLPGADGAPPLREAVFPSSGVDLLPALSPDGDTLAFFSDRSMAVQLWIGEVGHPDTLRAIEGLTPVPRHPAAWSPAGDTLLVVGKTAGGDRLFEVEAGSGRVRTLAVPDGVPAFASYAGARDRLLVGVDSGQGRLRLVLYALPDWRVLGSEDDVAVARHDDAGGAIYFTRPSRVGLWRADAMLRNVVEVSNAYPAPQLYRHWGLVDGMPYYVGSSGGCAAVWRPLPASAGAAVDAPRPPCLSRDGGVIAGSPAVDRRAGWIYLGLPVAENIDVGWTALPPSMQAPQAVPRVARP